MDINFARKSSYPMGDIVCSKAENRVDNNLCAYCATMFTLFPQIPTIYFPNKLSFSFIHFVMV